MWPTDPDEFESHVKAPASQSHEDAWYFLSVDGQMVCAAEHGVPRPVSRDDLRWMDMDLGDEHFLGIYRGRSCFALEGKGQILEGYAADNLFSWLGRVEPPLFYLAGRAQQVIDWHNSHRFCGRCGTATADHDADRAKVCPECSLVCYPRIAPSIIVLGTREDEMLLARNANWPNGMFSTLAGFVEVGESIEQTVHREVAEEVGIQLGGLRYLGSQSWPFPNSLMLGFHAEYAGGDIVCQQSEIAEARWFKVDDLPNIPPATAISRWLIDDFIDQVNARRA